MDIGSMTLAELVPYVGGGAGAVVLILALLFKDSIKIWLESKSFDRALLVKGVADMQKALDDHIREETKCWAENDARADKSKENAAKYWEANDERIDKAEEKIHALELNNVELRVTLTKQHESVVATLGEQNQRLGEQNQRIGELTTAVMTVLSKLK